MNRIKWNHSADKNVRVCQRKAFYTIRFARHQAKNGSLQREVHLLKQAIDVPLWRGNIVHFTLQECILPALRTGNQPDFPAARNWALNLVDKQVSFSKNENYRKTSKTSAKYEYCVLKSDFNGNGVTADEINEVKEGVITALNNLENQFFDLLLRAANSKKIEIEKELHFPLDDDIQVDAKIDFMFFEQSGRVFVIDWKAAESFSGNAREQLHAYAYAVIKCGYWQNVSWDNIVLIEANLMSGERAIYPFTEDDFYDVDDRIFTGSQLLKPLFEMPVEKFLPEDFESANSVGACQFCAVKEICNGNLYKASAVSPTLPFEFV